MLSIINNNITKSIQYRRFLCFMKEIFEFLNTFIALLSYFRSTFIVSRYKYILNKECVKGEEVEQVLSGSKIRHYWFADFIIIFRGFHPLQYSLKNYGKWKISLFTDIYDISKPSSLVKYLCFVICILDMIELGNKRAL